MKRATGHALLISGLLFFASCDSDKSSTTDTTSTDSTAVSTDHPAHDSTSADVVDMNPATPNGFVLTAAGGGMMEVELAKIVQQKATNKAVKDYAKMIEADHTKANEELKAIAYSKSITLPSGMPPEHQGHINDINARSGADFDKAYINMMVDDHNKDIAMFKDASTLFQDNDLKQFAVKTLPVLEKHLAKAKEVQAKLQ